MWICLWSLVLDSVGAHCKLALQGMMTDGSGSVVLYCLFFDQVWPSYDVCTCLLPLQCCEVTDTLLLEWTFGVDCLVSSAFGPVAIY